MGYRCAQKITLKVKNKEHTFIGLTKQTIQMITDRQKQKNGEIIPNLWIKTREEAKDKFKENFGSHEANEWIIFKYRSLGGDFPVRLLEHWQDNVRHGLFEGFDKFGNKTFKDEYKRGLRIKHRIFDKTKG